jgi:hypothetical protein
MSSAQRDFFRLHLLLNSISGPDGHIIELNALVAVAVHFFPTLTNQGLYKIYS